MSRTRITCDVCHQDWEVSAGFSIYTQQAIESCPCPRCGAYVLRCSPSDAPAPTAETRSGRGASPRGRSGFPDRS